MAKIGAADLRGAGGRYLQVKLEDHLEEKARLEMEMELKRIQDRLAAQEESLQQVYQIWGRCHIPT